MSSRITEIEFHDQPALELVTARGARALVSPFGGQLLSWQTAPGHEQLYLSDDAVFDRQRPIRGGIPVCFPQFGTQGKLPRHGFARTALWEVRESRAADDYALLTLGLTDEAAAPDNWLWPFDAELTVLLGQDRLDVELQVENTGHAQMAFTAALHTYLKVAEVENARLHGLQGHHFRDALSAESGEQQEAAEVLVVEGGMDRLYRNVDHPLLLVDGARRVAIDQEGFPDVVVWNPWEDGAARLDDLPNLGFRRMLCVEAAAASQRMALDPEESWFGRQSLVVC